MAKFVKQPVKIGDKVVTDLTILGTTAGKEYRVVATCRSDNKYNLRMRLWRLCDLIRPEEFAYIDDDGDVVCGVLGKGHFQTWIIA